MASVLFTQLAPTDLIPRFIREQFFIPYVIKVVPIIVIWIKVLYDMVWVVQPMDKEEIDSHFLNEVGKLKG
jgi:hypothetical protein